MLKMILDLISNAFGAVKGWLDFKNSGVGQRKAAEGMVKSAEDAAKKRRAEINKAVYEGDAATVNRIVNGLALLWAMVLAAAIFAAGCVADGPKYVAADRVVACVTNETGAVEYWRVPPLVMEDLLNAKVELGELKQELKIKEITR